METVNTALKEQPGGWFNVQIATTDELTFCPDVLTNENAGSVVVTPASNGLDILPVAESIRINESIDKTKSGIIYTIKGEFEIPYQSKALDTYFNDCINKKVVLFAIKRYGQQKLYGSKKFPLEFSYDPVNGQKYEDGNSIRVTVTGKIPQKPVFIND
ncbi:hypothetical protein [Leptobacterium sp. I13]|uniref:hypothetical protein n=1 Tax=Leptobacterium meishanense TaxID=3128904 RepID=UPI0030EDB25C